MNKNETLKLINQLYLDISFSLGNSRKYDKNLYLKELRRETRKHNEFMPSHIVRGITTATETKYFYVKRILEYIEGYKPKPENYLHIHQSIFIGYVLYFENKEKLIKNLNKDNIAKFMKLDYSELIQGKF